jgi:hypothetical protein
MRRKTGRRSAAELSVIPTTLPKRPPPPPEFDAQEAAVWKEVVDSMRADWFATSLPILRSYCSTVVLTDRSARAMRETDIADEKFAEHARAYRDSSKMLVRLATALRLTPRSNRATRFREGQEQAFRRPWEPESEPA